MARWSASAARAWRRWAPTWSAFSSGRRGCSASRWRSRYACCPGQRCTGPSWPLISHWRSPAMRWLRSSPRESCREPSRSWTAWPSRRQKPRWLPGTRRKPRPSLSSIWKGRKETFSAIGRLSTDYITGDGVVPRTRLGPALAEIERLSAQYGLRVANVFHAGDGNLHPLVLYDGRTPGELQRAEQLAGEVLRMCIRLGGSITGEHGVGMEKREYLTEMFGPDDIAVMRRLRRTMDPREIANRGKMFRPHDPAAPYPRRSPRGGSLPIAPLAPRLRKQTRALPCSP